MDERATSEQSPLVLGPVRLRVRDLERAEGFYVDLLGLVPVEPPSGTQDGELFLAPGGGPPLLHLISAPEAPRPFSATPGLFHLALLLPDRTSLARTLLRLAQHGVSLDGASDHLVSEALYLSDPEGNGVELYADRPRIDWKWEDGVIRMATLPLDLGELASEAAGESAPLPPKTRLGHLHFRVAALGEARRFFQGALGMPVTTDRYPGALFLAEDGYHHHVAVNIWGMPAGGRWNPDATGLVGYTLRYGDPSRADALREALIQEGFPVEGLPPGEEGGAGFQTRDMNGIPVRIV